MSPQEQARVLDVHRRPGLAYGAEDADGCGSLFVYGWTADRSEVVTVRLDDETPSTTGARTFDLAASNARLDVRLHVYERRWPSFPFCTDIGPIGIVEEVWRPTRGTVTIQLSPAGVSPRTPRSPRATVRISGAQFVIHRVFASTRPSRSR
jgi:hypothetical protein